MGNMDRNFKNLAGAGVAFGVPPQYSPDGTVKVVYCAGLKGVLLKLVDSLNV